MSRRRTAFILLFAGGLVTASAAVATPAGAATTWTTVSTPNRGTVADTLNGVSALSTSSAWAVGSSYDINKASPRTLIQRWNGTRWSTVTSPNITDFYNELYGVSASSANDAWAVGYANTLSGVNGWPSKTIAMHWNGTAWSTVATPNPAKQGNVLRAVKAFSPTDAWAVGYYYDGATNGDSGALALHWNGSTWTKVEVPEDATQLYSISATSANDIWAVGGNRTRQTVAVHYNGSTWTETPLPGSGTVFSELYGVTAISSNDAWAVGAKNNYAIPLTYHWNGTAWTEVATPPIGVGGNNPLRGVAAVSSTEVWAVGYTTTSDGPQVLAERWNGTSWQVESTPTFVTTMAGLWAVAAVRPSGGGSPSLWGVGDRTDWVTDGWADRTLALRGAGS
jgi:hypothetical protein